MCILCQHLLVRVLRWRESSILSYVDLFSARTKDKVYSPL